MFKEVNDTYIKQESNPGSSEATKGKVEKLRGVSTTVRNKTDWNQEAAETCTHQ